MLLINKLFNSQEQRKLLKALTQKNYTTLSELMGEDEEKAKLIFDLTKGIIQLEQIDWSITKIKSPQPTTTSSAPEDVNEDVNEGVNEIIIRLKNNFLNLLSGEKFLKPLPSGWYKGKKENTKVIYFKDFAIYEQENQFVLSREEWFKKLVIKKVNSNQEIIVVNQKNYYTALAPGSYLLTLDKKSRYLTLKH